MTGVSYPYLYGGLGSGTATPRISPRAGADPLFKKSLGPKNGLERRAWQFYTICDKNQGLKVKIGEVTAIPVHRSAAGQLQVTLGSAQKFVWGSMVDFQKTSCNFGAAPRRTVER
jgi:hypothetical protein